VSYSGPITDPFRIPAPDGHVYFDALTAPVALAPIYVGLATLITRCRAEAARHTDPAYRAFYTGWATRFDATAKLLRTQLAAIGVQTAAVADQSIKRHIKSTQVRPNTSKADHLGTRSSRATSPSGSRVALSASLTSAYWTRRSRAAAPTGRRRSSAPTRMWAARSGASSCPAAPAPTRAASACTRSSRPDAGRG
jgi:hypothetical protein